MNPMENEIDDQFAEVEDIFDYLLKQQFITPEDIDMVAAKFKNIFLTIDKKEDFLPFINNFIIKAEQNDEYNEERLEALKTEVESFYDRIATNFSVWHIAGYRDPNDEEEKSDKLSEDIDESFSFINSHKLNTNLFGPEIPEKIKPTIIKVLEKISTLYDQKLTNRVQLISRWRLSSLAKHIQKLKKQSPAITTIVKFIALQKSACFLKLKSRAQRMRQEKELQELKQQIDALQHKANGVTKIKEVKEVFVNDPKIEKELEKLKALYEEKERAFEELDNNFRNFRENDRLTRNSLKESSLETQNKIGALNALLDKFKMNEKNLIRKNEENEIALAGKEEDLKRTFKNLNDLMQELKILKESKNKDNLSSFGKLRYFMKTMKYVILSLKSYAFLRIFKRKEKAKMALINVTDRIKARLLIQTRNLNCGQDIRRSFLKWMIKSNPDFLREMFSKIAVTAKINHQVALWRMKKLTFKPIVQKLPEAVKVVRRLKAFFILNQLFQGREVRFKKDFLNKINPYHKTKAQLLLEKVMVHNNIKWNTLQKKHCLQKMKERRDIQKKLFEDLIRRNKDRMRIYFLKLKQKGRDQKNIQDLVKIFNAFQRMNRNYRESGIAFFAKFKKNDGVLKVLINNLIASLKAKKKSALSALLKNKELSYNEEFKNSLDKLYHKRCKEDIFRKLTKNASAKLRDSFNQLRKNRNLRNFQNNLDNLKKEKLFKLMSLKNIGKIRDAMKGMKNRKLGADKRDALFSKIFDKIRNQSYAKARKILQSLLAHKNARIWDENRKNQIKSKILSMLVERTIKKVRNCLTSLIENKNQKKQKENRLKLLMGNIMQKNRIKMLKEGYSSFAKNHQKNQEANNLSKNKKMILDLFKRANQQKLKNALNKLIENKRATSFADNLLVKNKERFLQKLRNSQKEKIMSSLKNLIQNKNNRNKEIEIIEQKQTKALQKLLLNNLQKRNKIFEKFVQSSRNSIKDNKKKIVDNIFKNMKNKMRMAFEKMARNRQHAQHQEKLKNNNLGNLFENLKNANKIKAMNCFSSLRQNRDKINIEIKKDENKKNNLIENLIKSQKNKVLITFYKTLVNALKLKMKEEKKNKLLNGVFENLKKKNQIKKENAFKQILQNMKDKKKSERDISKSKEIALKKLLDAMKNKGKECFGVMNRHALKKSSENKIDNIKNSYTNMVKMRRNKGLIMLMIASLNEKARRCLYELRRNLKEKIDQEKKRFETIGYKMEKLFEAYEKKKRGCFRLLREFKNDKEREEEEKFAEEEKRRNLLGIRTDPAERKKFMNFLKNLRGVGPAGPQKITQHFDNLVQFMENNNDNGQYDLLLKKIEKGEITNYEQLMDYILANNQNGSLDELKDQLDNENLDMNNLKHFINLNNQDGVYNSVLDLLEKNPNLDRIGLLKFIKANNQDGKMDPLLQNMNNEKKIRDLVDFMKKNNKDGKYNNALKFLEKQVNPDLSEFIKYVDRHNEDGKLNDLMKKINQTKKGEKQYTRLYNYMRRNNGDRRYDPVMKYLLMRRDPKLSDLVGFTIRNNNDGKFNGLLNTLDNLGENPVSKFLDEVRKNNADGRFDAFLEKNKDKNSSLFKLFKNLIGDKTNPVNRDLLEILNDENGVKLYKDYLKQNNSDGRFSEMLNELKKMKNPKKSDIFDLIARHNPNDGSFDKLVDLVNRNEKLDELADFARRRNRNGKYADLLDLIKNKPSMYQIANSVIGSNKNGEFNEILNKINGEDIEVPNYLDNLLDELDDSNELNLKKMADKLREIKDHSLLNVFDIIEKNNKSNIFDKALENANNNKNPKLMEDFKDFLKNNNRDGNLDIVKKLLETNPNEKLSNLIDFVDKNNKRGILRRAKNFLNEEEKNDLLENAMNYMLKNNESGKYDDLLKMLNNKDSPTLSDLMGYIKKNDKNGKYADLLKVINEKKNDEPMKRLRDYIDNNNKDQKYNDLLNSFKDRLNPKLNDVIEYALAHNEDHKYDDLLEKLLGRNINPTKLKEKLKLFNKSGAYNDVISFIEKNPNAKLSDVLKEVKNLNTNNRFKHLLDYINGGGEDDELLNVDPDSLFNFLLRAKKKGDFADLIKFIEKNNIHDPNEILNFLRNSKGEDEEYKNLIQKLEGYVKNSFSKPIEGKNKGLDMLRPQREKMRICFNAMKEHRNKVNDTQQQNDKLKNKLFTRLFNNKIDDLKNVLEKLKNNRFAQQEREEEKKRNSKNILRLLLKSGDAKLSDCFKKLRNFNSKINKLEQDKLKHTNKVLGILVQYCNRKKMITLDNLRNNNNYRKRLIKQVGNQLIKQYDNKKKVAMARLVENMKDKKNELRIKTKALKQLFNNCREKKRHAFNTMIDLFNNKIQHDENKKNLQNKLFRKLANALKNKEKKVLKNLLKNNAEVEVMSKKQEEEKKLVLKKLMEKLNNKLKNSFNSLKDNFYEKKIDANNRENVFKRLMKNAQVNYTNKKRDCFNSLKSNNEKSTEEEKRKNMLMMNVAKRLKENSQMKLNSILKTLRENCEKRQNNAEKREKGSKLLLDNLQKNLKNNLREAFKNLKEFARNRYEDEKNNNRAKQNVMRKLLGRQLRKTASAFKGLRENKINANKAEEDRTKRIKSLFLNMMQALDSKKKDCLGKLRKMNDNKKREVEVANCKINNMLCKLETKSQLKVAKTMGKLFENREEDLKNRDKIKQLLNMCVEKTTQKMKKAFGSLRENQLKKSHENDVKTKVLQNMVRNMYNRNLLKYFEKLVIHYMNRLLIENKQDNTFSRISVMNGFKKYKTMKDLQSLNNNIIQKRMIMNKLMGSTRSKGLVVLNELRKHAENRKKLLTKALTTIKHNINKEKANALKSLKMHNFLIKRNKISTRLNNMIYCIRKNHRHYLRKTLHHWAGTEYKNKVRMLNDTLNKVILHKKAGAYQAIKLKYLTLKYEKAIKGLMRLIAFTEEKEMKNKKEFMKIFIETFLDRNPWLKKTIHIWAILSKPNDQIAFWRMRYAKNLKKEGVSAEHTLKLNTMLHIIKKEIKRNLSHAFWKINAFADLSVSINQSGFNSMMKKY